MSDRVLLTGISGYLGGHIALQLLNAGYTVRGSLRDLARADRVRETLSRAGVSTSGLEFVALDLSKNEGWSAAARDCRFVLHTASPLVLRMPKNRMELIGPAVAGTERALTAALDADVERVVLTSSMAAIAYGHETPHPEPYTADEWTNLSGRGINAYQRSKTLAEQRAWEIMDRAGRHHALAAINPAVILGPVLDHDAGTSAQLVLRLLNGSVPGLPRIPITAVDIRDVAAAHVAAMTSPEAGGQRFPMGEEVIQLRDAAQILRQNFPKRPVPQLNIPDWVVRLYALFDSDVRSSITELGTPKHLDSSAAIALLGHPLIALEASLLATAESLIAQGLV
ncbi:hypothetical protein WH87_15040 [Devosia epidermidihirudinis]|uniref:NAD-dependent epimerase/dehydratase domain-containing protein n=1 Tax=Devosia epidermidihirudinis TaxID=1293439 RepID=A0A0F5Q4M5_9HYPH|nr:aldehyde reductase [Devosia epidermidihirudinis]KKC35883.1 hypothetical protein WH87_15040 [Devosia epidermidihirudinis]